MSPIILLASSHGIYLAFTDVGLPPDFWVMQSGAQKQTRGETNEEIEEGEQEMIGGLFLGTFPRMELSLLVTVILEIFFSTSSLTK